MNKSIRKRKTAWRASLGLMFMAMNQSALAGYFHYFIDIETTYMVNQKNLLSEVNVSWEYDGKMSSLMREQSSNLKALGEATIKHLHRHHYFINIQFNGKPVKTGQATLSSLQEFVNKGRAALRLNFILPILHPLNMNGQNELTWNFSDPAGVAIMSYSTSNNIRLDHVLQRLCKPVIKQNESALDENPKQLLSLKCSL